MENIGLEYGSATKKLAEIIPLENIVTYFAHYKVFREIDIKSLPDFPLKEVSTIALSLTALKGREWFTEDDAGAFFAEGRFYGLNAEKTTFDEIGKRL